MCHSYYYLLESILSFAQTMYVHRTSFGKSRIKLNLCPCKQKPLSSFFHFSIFFYIYFSIFIFMCLQSLLQPKICYLLSWSLFSAATFTSPHLAFTHTHTFCMWQAKFLVSQKILHLKFSLMWEIFNFWILTKSFLLHVNKNILKATSFHAYAMTTT